MMIFRQLFDPESSTYTYLIGDPATKEAVFIDPVNTRVDEYLNLLNKYALKLKYSLETHAHADHITASGLLRQRTGAKTGIGQACGAQYADYQLKDGVVLAFGQGEEIKVLATPGHTPGSVSYLWRDRVFTGDALLINGCGRTDFQGGDPGVLYDSITQKLFTLPGETIVYPGHDYNGRWVSSIEQERTRNGRLAGKTRSEFIEIMNNLNLPKPQRIDEAVPANRRCGLTEEEIRQDTMMMGEKRVSTPQDLVQEARKQVREIDVATVKQRLGDGKTAIIDVREPEEFAAGHLPGAINVPRGVLEFRLGNTAELADPNVPIMLYCQTGGRAALAAWSLKCLGYTDAVLIAGGYDAWRAAEQNAN
ncbi:MBL fold metallo-hydrolase [Nitrosococcus watsonii]|nr:MBL fold metallo-hydrolase [Nitrosococcus watsonii]